MTSVSVLIPFRDDPAGFRGRLFRWVEPRWVASGFQVCIGTDAGPGPFSINRALNDARAVATGDVLVVMGADHVPDVEHVAYVAGKLRTWAVLFDARRVYTQDATRHLLQLGRQPCSCGDLPTESKGSGKAPGIVAVRAEVWDDLGGRDERFAGWGGEDRAYAHALNTLVGRPATFRRTVFDLWHPVTARQITPGNRALLDVYKAARGHRQAMRQVLGNEPGRGAARGLTTAGAGAGIVPPKWLGR